MLTVTLEDDVVAGLQKRAVPLVDDFNTVIRRLLKEVDAADENLELSGFSSDTSNNTKRERTLHTLLRKGILGAGTRLILDTRQVRGRVSDSWDPAKLRCKVSDSPRSRQNIIWDYDGQSYSLSKLSELMRNEHGLPFVGGALNGYDFWCLADKPGKSLWELADENGRV